MAAYFRCSVQDFLICADDVVLARLTTAYASDGYLSQYTSATIAWTLTLPALRRELQQLVTVAAEAVTWQVLLEYPLYRLRRRIDAVLITPNAVVVIELKTGAANFESVDKRQAVEYAQDLRDFHAGSKQLHLCPILWALEADELAVVSPSGIRCPGVGTLSLVGRVGLADAVVQLVGTPHFPSAEASEIFGSGWDAAPYEPVPSVIDAAVTLFAGHGVREITVAGARNLGEAADTVFSIVEASRERSQHAVVFLTGVPGAGKTLAGLNIVHRAVDRGVTTDGDIVYLSGNTPLVVVLREALAQDKHARNVAACSESTLRDVRSSTRATIQHINDFLQEYVRGSSAPPSGHVIVFDEAQRAWDARQGKQKFGREASEPYLVLETMYRHADWSVTVCLIGIGQEINDGEEGLGGWADAVQRLSTTEPSRWRVYGPDSIFNNQRSVRTLGPMPPDVESSRDDSLHLDVPMRSFRSPQLGQWIDALLAGDFDVAKRISMQMSYPLKVTRDLHNAKAWLNEMTRGERRKGLLASSGARRLRADGIGELLNATDGAAIAHWYLKPTGDIRSSHALEVPANEYTSQGLEVDFAGLCWGGDLIIRNGVWITRRIGGNRWNEVSDPKGALYLLNSYRVLLSRAREGLVIWVPRGDTTDHTRSPTDLDAVAQSLINSGCTIPETEHHNPLAQLAGAQVDRS